MVGGRMLVVDIFMLLHEDDRTRMMDLVGKV